MSTADIKKTAETKMARSIESFKGELQKIRTGRAHPGMLDQIHVDYYGSPVPLSQVAALSLLDARTIGVQPWEKPMISKVEKAIRESDLGLNPSTTGEIIRVPMPALTEERRRDITKVLGKDAEAARVAIRNVRRDVMSDIKDLLKEKLISQDDERRAETEVQKLTDKFVADIDQVLAAKEKEIMQV
jgi:ribosome recycling factor